MTRNKPNPEWIHENEQIRKKMNLQPYLPPRFSDGTPTHEVVPELEDRMNGTIRFIALNPTYPDDWEVQINGKTAFHVGRHRDGDGNTVYEVTASEFRAMVEQWRQNLQEVE